MQTDAHFFVPNFDTLFNEFLVSWRVHLKVKILLMLSQLIYKRKFLTLEVSTCERVLKKGFATLWQRAVQHLSTCLNSG